jgi:predicted dehydrogenase
MPPVRAAIIGTGNSVGNHLVAYETMADRVQLVAAVDIQEARVRAVCDQHGIPHAYTDVGEMLRQEQPDLVSIVTPPALHKPQIIECLEAGAWVYCEKPLCASLADFDEISAAEQRTGRFVSTVFQWRFGSAAKHLKALIEKNALGRPLVGVCNALWYREQDYYNVSWRGKWATEFGGPTVTLGIHLMDLLLWMLGDWREVRAMTGRLERDIEFEDCSMALVQFENGAMGSIINSVLSPRQQSYMRLDFHEASVEVSTLYRYSNEHWRFSAPNGNTSAPVLEHWAALRDNTASGHDVQLAEILDCMECGKRPLVSGVEARRILEFVASLYKAASLGRPVQRGEITADDLFYHAMNGMPTTVDRG